MRGRLSSQLAGRTRRRPAPRSESGFALLVVFLMAAIAAISLYMEMPRLAFQSQRQKEQMLMERGLQYKRAIQLFLRASNNQRWPANVDELESFNGKRFLRRRYKDPMTGKDEWRLIHIQNGVLTDSVLNKQPKDKQADQKDDLANQTVGDYGGSVGAYNSPSGPGGGALNAATRRRASDNQQPGAPGSTIPGGLPTSPDGTQPGGQTNPTGLPGQGLQSGLPGQQPQQPGLPGQQPTQPVFPPGVPGMPGQTGTVLPGQTPGQSTNSSNNQGYSTVGNYGSTVGTSGTVGSTPSTPGGMGQQYPGMPGPPANSQNFGGTPAYPSTQGANGLPPNYPQPGMQINPNQQSAAQNLIGSLLTTPRPGGLQGINQGQTIGGGIAGVASTLDADSIMVYNDRTNYGEWEFVYDPTKARYPPPNPVTAGTVGTPAAQLGSMPTGSTGTPAAQLGTPAGNTPGVQGTTGTATTGTGTAAMGGMGSTNMQPDIRPGQK